MQASDLSRDAFFCRRHNSFASSLGKGSSRYVYIYIYVCVCVCSFRDYVRCIADIYIYIHISTFLNIYIYTCISLSANVAIVESGFKVLRAKGSLLARGALSFWKYGSSPRGGVSERADL